MRMPNPAKEEQTRAEIIAAAQNLFQKYGLDKATMEDIAQAAGKAKSSLYYYYPNKEDVFYAVARQEGDEVVATIRSAVEKQKAPADKLKTHLLTHAREVRKKMNLYPALLADSGKHFPLFRRIQRDANTAEMEALKAILLEGVRNGDFRQITEQDCEALAMSMLQMMRGFDAEMLVAGRVPADEVGPELPLEIFIRGLR